MPTANAGLTSTGSDGNVWFSENTGHKIGKITPAGTATDYPAPTAGANPAHLATGPDGKLWVTYSGVDKIAAVTTS
ncbi:hypothetical protein [Streptomyces sp. NPDC051546]|uniref:virginiamycin B lyase family protein n=1 Tax=Streptomyces sp. NPDC051546 TaxID=3365655 RepID=UPI0037AC10AB